MTEKESKKAPAKKTDSKKLSKKGEFKEELVWAGAERFLEGEEGDKKRKQLQVVSEILNVTPLGVNILGGKPYLNNLGRKDKLNRYTDGKATFDYNWVNRSLSDDDKAICEARIIVDGKVLEVNGIKMPWVVGECSPKSIKMGTLKGYQNHMAQTRAENRAFEYAFGLKLHYEVMGRIGEKIEKGDITKDNARAVAQASSGPSAEEMQPDEVIDYDEQDGLTGEIVEVISTCQDMGANGLDEIVDMINDVSELDIDDVKDLSRKEAKKVLAELMAKKNDND